MFLKAITRLAILIVLVLAGLTRYSEACPATGCLAQEVQCEAKCGDNGACILNCQAQYQACKNRQGITVVLQHPLDKDIVVNTTQVSSHDLPNHPDQMNLYDPRVLVRDHQIWSSTTQGIW